MAKEKFSSIELDDAAEWMLSTVEIGNVYDIYKTIEETLDIDFCKESVITEKDIDDGIEARLDSAKIYYENGDIDKVAHEEWVLEIGDRKIMKNELLEAGVGIRLDESYAATELLAVLLGEPSLVFDYAAVSYGNKFTKQINALCRFNDREILRNILPKSLEVIEILKDKKSMRVLGFVEKEEIKDWLNNLNQLEESLSGKLNKGD